MGLNKLYAMAVAVMVAVAVMLPLGCVSYKFNGSAIDYTVYRTIHVSEFPIRAV